MPDFRRPISLLLLSLMAACPPVSAGTQKEEDLSDSVKTHMRGMVSERGAGKLFFDSPEEEAAWLNEMSARLLQILPKESILREKAARLSFLTALHYEATRAGISPQLMLAIVHVESAFRKYAISSAGARGYMQVMPFWTKTIGEQGHNLFKLRTNLRYGAIIFRHYLDIEKGDVRRALARYNGSLGKNRYPNAVLGRLKKHWQWSP